MRRWALQGEAALREGRLGAGLRGALCSDLASVPSPQLYLWPRGAGDKAGACCWAVRVPGWGAAALLGCGAAWLRSAWRTSCSSAPPGGELSLRKVSAFQKKGLRKRVGILVILPRRPRAAWRSANAEIGRGGSAPRSEQLGRELFFGLPATLTSPLMAVFQLGESC